MEEAERGIFIGSDIEKVGCFEIEYTTTKPLTPKRDELSRDRSSIRDYSSQSRAWR